MENIGFATGGRVSLENNWNLRRRNPRGYFGGNGHLTKISQTAHPSKDELVNLSKSDKRRNRKLLFNYLALTAVIIVFVTYLTIAVGF